METVPPRIALLSTPKEAVGYHEDRRSVYWDNDLSNKDYSTTTKIVTTQRVDELSTPKKLHPDYVGDRPSPQWEVSEAACIATPSQRVEQLAKPKKVHPSYRPCKPVMTVISDNALFALPTNRIKQLAEPKTYPELNIKADSEWDWSEWKSDLVTMAEGAKASERVEYLARPKTAPPIYQPAREVQWPVSASAKSIQASERLQKLARPKNKGTWEDYDPNAYSVSLGAKHAHASPRINELSAPLPRKCSTKK